MYFFELANFYEGLFLKALIISDLHSNVQALEAIWKLENDSDFIYCAGDLVDIGPNPNEVIEWLVSHQAVCIQGNHDEYLLNMIEAKIDVAAIPRNERTWLHYNAEIIKPESLAYLKTLPKTHSFELDGEIYFMKHIYDGYNIIQSKYEFDLFMARQNVPADHHLILGHTHKQTVAHFSKTQIMLNPGSTAYRTYLEPENTCPKAEYATITDGCIELKGLEFDKSDLLRHVRSLEGRVDAASFARMIRRVS